MPYNLSRKSIYLIFLFLLLIPFLSNVVMAITIPNPLEWDTVEEVIQGIIDFIFWVAVVLVPLMVIISAFFFLTSAGNPERIRSAKNIIMYTAIGFGIVLLAKALVSVLNSIIGG